MESTEPARWVTDSERLAVKRRADDAIQQTLTAASSRFDRAQAQLSGATDVLRDAMRQLLDLAARSLVIEALVTDGVFVVDDPEVKQVRQKMATALDNLAVARTAVNKASEQAERCTLAYDDAKQASTRHFGKQASK